MSAALRWGEAWGRRSVCVGSARLHCHYHDELLRAINLEQDAAASDATTNCALCAAEESHVAFERVLAHLGKRLVNLISGLAREPMQLAAGTITVSRPMLGAVANVVGIWVTRSPEA
jgi:hypothetical protein